MSPGTRSAPSTVTAPAVAQHGGAWGEHSPDRRHRRLGLALLEKADHRIGQHHGEDHAGIDPVLQGPRHHGRAQQHIDQHVVELHEEPQHRPARPHLGQAVRSMLGQPPRGLLHVQPLGACIQFRQTDSGGLGVGTGHRHL